MSQQNSYIVEKKLNIFEATKSVWNTLKGIKAASYKYYKPEKIKGFHINKPTITELKNSLNKKMDFSEIIDISQAKFPVSQKFIFQRLKNLNDMYIEENAENISLGSLKSLLIFLYSIKNFEKPAITLNDLGYFQTSWKKDKNNLLTASFKENYFLNYVIFIPSTHTSKRIILNGSMNVFDFKDYLKKLGVKIHKVRNVRN